LVVCCGGGVGWGGGGGGGGVGGGRCRRAFHLVYCKPLGVDIPTSIGLTLSHQPRRELRIVTVAIKGGRVEISS